MKRILIALVAVYAVYCAALFFFQRALVFPAPRDEARSRAMKKVPLKNGAFMLTALLEGDGPVVVHFHGNAEQVAWLDWLSELYVANEISFVAVEYPGYPGTTGSASEPALLDTAQLALETLNVDRKRIVLEGQSVGTGVAVAMAEKGWGAKLVLLSPYTSLVDVAKGVISYAPVSLLMRDRFDSLSRAPSIDLPVLVIHGTKDEVIPFALGERLAKAFPKAELVPVEGAHHNDLWDARGVQDAVLAFVK